MGRTDGPSGLGSEHGRVRRAWVRARPIVIPMILLLCVTLPHLDDGDWRRTDTGWYAAIGVQAWRTGSLWTLWGGPGQAYFNKPPLAIWIHGLVLHVFGTGALAARLPTVAAAAGCVGLTALIGRRLSGRNVAMASGVALAFTYQFFRRVREISLDMWQLLFLLAFVALAVESVRRARGRGWWGMSAGLPLAAAMLTKPLVGLAAVALVVAWAAWEGTIRRVGWFLAGTGLGVGLASIWHVGMVLEHGEEFARQYFGAEVASRAAGAPEEDMSGPGFYLEKIVETYWPWLLAVAGTLVVWARRGAPTRSGTLERLALAWVLGWLVLLEAFPERRDRYAMVLWPGLAWLAGVGMIHAGPLALRGVLRSVSRWLAPAVVMGALVFSLIPIRIQKPIDPQWPALFGWIEGEGIGEGELWQGAFDPSRGARLYLRYGWWPRTTRNRWGEIVAEPPEGAHLIYHRRDGLAPGVNEEVVYEIGDIGVTRLGAGGWRPVEIPDPGEEGEGWSPVPAGEPRGESG